MMHGHTYIIQYFSLPRIEPRLRGLPAHVLVRIGIILPICPFGQALVSGVLFIFRLV